MKFEVGDILYDPVEIDVVKIVATSGTNLYKIKVIRDPYQIWTTDGEQISTITAGPMEECCKRIGNGEKSLGLLLFS